MRSFLPSIIFLTVSWLLQSNAIAAPLTIEINDSIHAIPYEAGDVDKDISSSFVQTIDVANIRNTQLDVGQIIENYSGIKIRRIGGLGSYSSISIRGKSSDQVMVYLDGVLVNNASGGGVDLSQIPINSISRIEVYKDIIPVEFSEAANGGVINLITHRAKNNKSTRVTTGAGSFNTLSLDIDHRNYYKNWQFIFSGGHLSSANDFPFKNENGTLENPYDDKMENRQNNQLKQYNVVAKARLKMSDVESIQYQTDFFNKLKHIPTTENKSNANAFISYDNKTFNVNYLNTEAGSNKLSININAAANLKNTRYDDKEKTIGLEKMLIDQQVKSVAAKVYVKYSHNHYRWVNNAHFRYEKLILDDLFKPEKNRSNNRVTLSNALQGDFFFNNKKIIVSPAGRFFISADSFNGSTLSESDNQTKQHYTLTPQIGVRYQLFKNTGIKFNAGKYYRLPNYVELFGTRGYIGSNETLKPEQGINIDGGFEHLSYPASETYTKFQWNLNLYHSVITDEIVYSFDARGIGKPSNNKKSSITGIENNVTLEVNYIFEISSNTTLQLPLNRSDPEETTLLAGRSLWSQSTRITAEKNPFNIFLEHHWEGAYYYANPHLLRGKPRSIVNAGVKLRSKKILINLTLNNIFNHRNKDFYSQVSPGFAVFLSTIFYIT